MINKQKENLTGILQKTIYYNNENGYFVGSILHGKGSNVVVGYLPAPREGEEYHFVGSWKSHTKYGNQFQFDDWQTKLPSTETGIEEYLASGLIKGIGPSLAVRIVKHFGNSTLHVLNNHPERLLEVEGIGQKKFAAIQVALTSLKEMQEVMVYLKSLGISTHHAIKLYKTYGNHVSAILQNNPYQVIDDVVGFGFKTADEIASKLGVTKESVFRLTAGLRYVLDDACRNGGHCFLPRETLSDRAAQLLIVDEAKVERALDVAIDQQYIISENSSVFPLKLHFAETSAAKCLEKLLRKNVHPFSEKKLSAALKKIEEHRNIEFAEKQREAILDSVKNPVTILTGGPGTGKTLCVNGIIELADILDFSYMLCAPTGRAAKRLSEVSQREAKTIHRLLEFDPMQGTFRRDEENPLDCRLLIVDEVSMVDIQLFDALLRAINPESQLVLVGDVDQLPSVGSGQVLRDLIESKKIPTVRLNIIFRQTSGSSIITNSHRINNGEYPELTAEFQLMEENDQEKIRQTIVHLCSTILPQNNRLNPFTDIQVLSPMNNGICGVKELNKQLQHVLNGNSRVCWQGNERKFLIGDKVMQIRNNYDKDVYNGDIGRVCDVDKLDGKLIVDFDGKIVDYNFDSLDEIVLAYATTIHKSQGNEFKSVIIPLTLSHFIMLQRNLIYTAVSRAKERLIFVGQPKALAIGLRNANVLERNTMLKKRIQELI